ncbi:hypothetical protein Salmuc_04694 [Salipiger mucosus DSM 16094]|uniref:Uncharacterized protein n=1 Tax=Salipiger mucosus DSM 16094 TaxID=1123237 RepID=S9QAY6_9RHOB|nr:hypothetical protein Salmuc_04694 [Salipiger mucosus DSM 16094]
MECGVFFRELLQELWLIGNNELVHSSLLPFELVDGMHLCHLGG